MGEFSIRPARRSEAAALSALALRSKAHWGYDAEFMEQCREALTYTSEDCARGMFVAEQSDTVVGVARLLGTPPVGHFEDLFVDPPAIGGGVGRALFHHVVAYARSAGFVALELDAEPHAVGFCARQGAETIGVTPSGAIPGRTLPRMRIQL